jgi:hypothetical protein
MPNPVPVITEEAKERIRGFVNAVESLQVTYGVGITADEGTLVIFDTRRKSEWIMDDGTVYGEWDAFFFGTDGEYPAVSLEDLEFEDFDGWNR